MNQSILFLFMLLKKVDKLILVPFIKLFILILGITIFIILMQFFLIFFDELIGKGLGLKIYLQLFFYFGITVTPKAFPLATLVASLMTFGNLGESLEVTALKSAGTSLLRIMRPLILLVSLLSGLVFLSNGLLVPKITVKAYSLLYDLRKKKASIAIREGEFYNGIPDYSIRVEKKLPDEKTLLGIIIYDHTKKKGNISMTTAEYGELYTIEDGHYLVVELFKGHNYLEEPLETTDSEQDRIPNFYRTSFEKQKLLLDLDEFKLTRTNKDLFSYHHTTKTTQQLNRDINERRESIHFAKQALWQASKQHWFWLTEEEEYLNKNEQKSLSIDNIASVLPNQGNDTALAPGEVRKQIGRHDPYSMPENDVMYAPKILQKALIQAKDYKKQLIQELEIIKKETKEIKVDTIEKNQRLASALGCLIMLLIGAPLGALIKKGGLGIPLLISTVFILLYYMADIFGSRWAKIGVFDSITGAWAPNIVMLPFGIFFLIQAHKDSRLLDKDGYIIWMQRWKRYFKKRNHHKV